MESTNFAKLLKNDGHYTIFAPTDAAFDKLDESTRQKLLNGDACALSKFLLTLFTLIEQNYK